MSNFAVWFDTILHNYYWTSYWEYKQTNLFIYKLYPDSEINHDGSQEQ